MKELFLAITLLIVSCITPTITIVKSIQFNQQCAGFLKQTADANNPKIALQRINRALNYIEANNLTKGYTSVLWRTEDDNVGFWYKNIKACKSELEECLNSTQLEQTNVLMKVRESLTDNGEGGTTLTIPYGISRYPSNVLFALLNTISVLLFAFSIFWLVAVLSYKG